MMVTLNQTSLTAQDQLTLEARITEYCQRHHVGRHQAIEVLNKAQEVLEVHYVPVPLKIFEAAEAALGEVFTGTINQLDGWVRQNLPEQWLTYTDPKKAKKYPHRYVWTAYLA